MTCDRDGYGAIVVTGGSGFGFLWGQGIYFFKSSPLYPYLPLGGGGVSSSSDWRIGVRFPVGAGNFFF